MLESNQLSHHDTTEFSGNRLSAFDFEPGHSQLLEQFLPVDVRVDSGGLASLSPRGGSRAGEIEPPKGFAAARNTLRCEGFEGLTSLGGTDE